VTKGGSRDFHGALYENYRSDGLDANTWARNRSSDPVQRAGPPLIDFNQFGYNLSAR